MKKLQKKYYVNLKLFCKNVSFCRFGVWGCYFVVVIYEKRTIYMRNYLSVNNLQRGARGMGPLQRKVLCDPKKFFAYFSE